MTTRIAPARALLLVLLLLGFGMPVVAADRDPLANVEKMEAPQVQADPPGLFAENQIQGLTGVVNEARQHGVPLVVRAISVPTEADILVANAPVEDVVPSGQQVVQRMAEEWLGTEVVESSPGAEDGILLLVVIPEDDHTRTLAAFAAGPNALPLNGLTQQRLDNAVHEVMYPFFEANSIASGIQSGVAVISYDNLFAVPARLERSPQQERLFTVANSVIAGLCLAGVAGLGALVAWVRRRPRPLGTHDGPLTVFEAATLARGRVDDQVLAGAILSLMRSGILVRTGDDTYQLHRQVATDDPFVARIVAVLDAEADASGILPGRAIRRSGEILGGPRAWLEDHLAEHGLFNADARVERTWVLGGTVIVAALALFTVVPSLAAMSRVGILAIVVAALAVIATWIWLARRSWTTPAGREALRQWTSQRQTPEELVVYDLIVKQDALIAGDGGPTIPADVHIIREIRALGTG